MNATPRILQVGEDLPPMDGPRERTPTTEKTSKPKRTHNSRGRFECINSFLDATMAGLDRAELAVWLLLWRDTKPDGLARTSQDDLARRSGCAARTIRRGLAELVRRGLVKIVYQGGFPRRLSVYRVVPFVAD